MIGKLWFYFGAIGTISVLGWVAALILFAAFLRSRRRTQIYWIALVAAVSALLFAKINSHHVSVIEVDRSEEQAQAIERQKQLRQQLEQDQQKKAANVRFAEDTPTDALDLAGVTTTFADKYEQAAAAEDPAKYAYRQRGKQQREVSASAETNEVVAGGVAQEVKPQLARQLPESDVVKANRLDRINLFCAQFTFIVACVFVAWDYLSRFNRTLGHLYPLPIAHRAIDSAWPKQHTVLMQGAAPEMITTYLKNVVRKGENFIYFGECDPLPEAQTLPKLGLRNWVWWSLQKITMGVGHKSYDNEFVFETAWFQRYAFVTTGATEAVRRLSGLTEFLRQRQLTRARARKTVHVVWNFQGTPPADLASVASLCRETNFKLIVVGAVTTGLHLEETIQAITQR